MQVGPHAASKGFRAIFFDALASTSDEAMALARAGEATGLWVLAGEQTKGRGRHGRSWSSPRGNLHASVLLVEPCAPRHAAQLGFVAGVSLLQGLRAVAPTAPFALKWPNDILLSGAKLAGLLVEGATLPGNVFACVIGFGVNCAQAPQGLPYRATSLAASGVSCAPDALLPPLSDSLARNLGLWCSGDNFAAIRSAWLAGAHGVGQPLEARTHDRTIRGVFESIDEQGRLILATSSGRASVEAGDVFPLTENDGAVAGSRT